MATIFRNDSAHPPQFGIGPAERGQQALHQFERHARPAEILFRVTAIPPIGIEHGQRGRQFAFGQVVIGDDDVDAQLAGALHHLRGANAGIHADDQT